MARNQNLKDELKQAYEARRSMGQKMRERLVAIQNGHVEDKDGWVMRV